MSRLRAERSPLRQLLMGIVALILIAAALDVVWVHRVSTPPERTDEGVLTTKGNSQVRADVIWGALLLVGGGGLFAVALIGLIDRKPIVDIRDDGIELLVAGPGRRLFVPWEDIADVRSTTDEDPDGGKPVSVLTIELEHQGGMPAEPWGAEWEGRTLRVDAEGWTVPPEEVAVHAKLALYQHRREHRSPPE